MNSIKLLDGGRMYKIIAFCVNLIEPERKVPATLPTSTAARFRAATSLAVAVKEMGYTQEIGYQTIMYPSEQDTRKLLTFILDKVPRAERVEVASSATGSGRRAQSLQSQINAALAKFTGERYSVLNKSARVQSHFATFNTYAVQPPEPAPANAHVKRYVTEFQPPLPAQPAKRVSIAPSVFELNAVDLAKAEESARAHESEAIRRRTERRQALSLAVASAIKSGLSQYAEKRAGAASVRSMLDAQNWSNIYKESSAFSRKADFTQERSDAQVAGLTQEELDAIAQAEREAREKERAEELAALQAEVDQAAADLADCENELSQLVATTRNLESELQQLTTRADQMATTAQVRMRVLGLLPNAEENMAKLQQLADASAARILELGNQWEGVRTPLVALYRKRKQQLAERKRTIAEKADAIRRMRRDMKVMVAEVKEKEALYEQVVAELNALPKSINRQHYIRRITDIVRTLEKQKDEARKILESVRSTQREIAVKAESVKRSFDAADDLIYQIAKVRRDPTAIKVYKHIVDLRNGFNDIIDTIEATGKTQNDIRELEVKVDLLAAKNAALNFDQVTADLEQVRNENKDLKEALKKLKQQVAEDHE